MLDAPPVSAEDIESIVDELLSKEQRGALARRGACEGRHTAAFLGTFEYRVKKLASGLAVAFRQVVKDDVTRDGKPEAVEPADELLVGDRPPREMPREPPRRSPTGSSPWAANMRGSAKRRTSPPGALRATGARRTGDSRTTGARPTGPSRSVSPTLGARHAAGPAPPSSAPPRVAPLSGSHPTFKSPFAAGTLPGLLQEIFTHGGSDLIVSAGTSACARLWGTYVEIPHAVFDDAAIWEVLEQGVEERHQERLDLTGSVDLGLSLEHDGGPARRFRTSIFRQRGGLAAVFRPIPEIVPTLESLHLPSQLASLGRLSHGLVLICGSAGSGRTTTLAAVIEAINQSRACHIVTLEDPIELVFTRGRSLIHQREIGYHVLDVATGLEAALRESPDLVCVSALDSPEATAAALTLAECGAVVLAVVNAGTASLAVESLVDAFPPHRHSRIRAQLAEVLRVVLTQKLLVTANGRSRVPALEVLVADQMVGTLIRDRQTRDFTKHLHTTRRTGAIAFDQSLAELIQRGAVSKGTAMRVAHDARLLDSLLHK